LHRSLAAAAAEAEKVATAVELPENVRFQRARRLIREALAEAGVSGKIEDLVAKLLGPA
jgi:transcription initiation factor TFIIIB Brf1 subunit/transcription initiation factor TFIIB